MASLKVRGVQGEKYIKMYVELEGTLGLLKSEISKRRGCNPSEIKVVFQGRVMNDDNKTLREYSIKNGSKLHAIKSHSHAEIKLLNMALRDSRARELFEDKQLRRLPAIKDVAMRCTKSEHANGIPEELKMVQVCYATAKHLMKKEMYKDAIFMLAVAEDQNCLCGEPEVSAIMGPVLHLDTVWCYFRLHDMEFLPRARDRLGKAQLGLDQKYWKSYDLSYQPFLALCFRLLLFKGITAFYLSRSSECKKFLLSAKPLYGRLQFCDEHYRSKLMSMGFKESEVKRALKLNMSDYDLALKNLNDENVMLLQQRKESIRQRHRSMGVPDCSNENQLADSSQRNDNDVQEFSLPAAKAAMEELISFGFPRKRVVQAAENLGSRLVHVNLDDVEPENVQCLVDVEDEMGQSGDLEHGIEYMLRTSGPEYFDIEVTEEREGQVLKEFLDLVNRE